MEKYQPNTPFDLPLLVTKSLLVLPKANQTLFVERKYSIAAFKDAVDNFDSYCVVTCQKKENTKEISEEGDIFSWGTLCRISNVSNNGKSYRASIVGLERVKINKINLNVNEFTCNATIINEARGEDNEELILVRKIIEMIPNVNPDVAFINNGNTASIMAKLSLGLNALDLSYALIEALNVSNFTRYELLKVNSVNERLLKIVVILNNIDENQKIEQRISQAVRESTEKSQKEYFLREKMKAIQKELGDDSANFENEINEKIKNKLYPQEVKDKVKDELKRYNTMPQGSLESSLICDYINIVLDVPWFEKTVDNDNIKNAKIVLDEDHYGLKKVKERILEYLAVKKMNGNLKAPILCFYGPPGCGKTSLCRSIARSLDRKFVKISLGGISDEGEIRGHRRTYVGSRPGRIVNALRKTKVSNPVFLLDEIDKLGRDTFKGDPSSALLEVLDPEQNTQFYDNYLELNYNLSNVIFICTANDLSTIPAPLMDRLELIEVDSYTLIDKVQIAKDFLIPRELKNNGLTDKQVQFTDEGIAFIIERYTKESGVRDLERKIASVLRKTVVSILEGKNNECSIVDDKKVRKLLGIEDYDPANKEKGSQIGVVTGLAWTPYGGEILPIEVNYFEGKGNLVLTGNLGDVMKESCAIALDYIKSNADKYGIDKEIFTKNDIHVHVPEGAVSKDGPSAGCAITTAMVSALKKVAVSGDIAMTGEVTLRGNALPIGGLREKSLAALRSGIKTILVPADNKKMVQELPKEIKDNLKIVYMKNVSDAIEYCLGK